VAPVQVIIVPIPGRSEDETALVADAVAGLLKELLAQDVRAEADWSDHRPGWKFNEWELKGVPVRLEVGPRDLKTDQVTLVRRDSRAKEQVSLSAAVARAKTLLDEVQVALFDRAVAFRQANTHNAEDYATFKQIMQERRGFIRAYWCGSIECETRIKEETRATIRVIPEDAEADGTGSCVYDGQPATVRPLFAQSY
jgi:prolyl-tRNA synthetase